VAGVLGAVGFGGGAFDDVGGCGGESVFAEFAHGDCGWVYESFALEEVVEAVVEETEGHLAQVGQFAVDACE